VFQQNILLSIATCAPLPVYEGAPFSEAAIHQWSLRDYQVALLTEVARLMALGYRRILIQLPTGGGKTRMAGAMLGSIDGTGQFIVHRKELIDQTSSTFDELGIRHGFIAAGRPDDFAPVMLAGVQTLVNRLGLPPDLAIIDEAHHATASSWDRIMEHYYDSYALGLSATPERLDGRGLQDHFDVIVCGPSTAWLIEHGYLSPYSYYAPSLPDLTGVHTVAGDFNRGELAHAMDKPKLIGDVVEHYLQLASGKQGIVFGASREHSRNLADAFAFNGVRAAHVDGSMGDKQRKSIVDAFREGALDVMTNVDLFGEGFDVPGIVYVGLARPTKSLALFLQQVGRGLRVIPGKTEAVICDHAGNAFRHGLPDDEREWKLEGRPKQARGAPADAFPIRQCETCFRISPSSVRECPGCGEEFPIQVRELRQEAGKLTKLEREELRKAASRRRKAEEKECKTYEQFKSLAIARGYDHPHAWAKMKMSFKNGGYRRRV
jgi:superfamily II DNA or RNA helicase